MRPIVTDVAWSLLWLFVTTMSCAETAKPIKPFGDCPRYRILDGDRDPTGKMGIFFGGGARHLLAYCEVYGISGIGHGYSAGGSIDAAFRCQYCSNLLRTQLPLPRLGGGMFSPVLVCFVCLFVGSITRTSGRMFIIYGGLVRQRNREKDTYRQISQILPAQGYFSISQWILLQIFTDG